MRWMWIDRIIAFEPRRSLTAIKCVSLAESHLHDHFSPDSGRPASPVMPTSLIIEGMAQTAGILVGSVNRFREKVVLAKIVRAVLDEDVLPGQTIRYTALIDRIDAAGASTTGTVERLDHAKPGDPWEAIGAVDLLFSHVDRNLAGATFPEANFVFSDNFRTLVESAGIPFDAPA